ncbi:MAG: hypothetical protein AB8B93_18080 [Pseudomonadales bacterium]
MAVMLLGISACTTVETDPQIAKRMELERAMAAALNAEDLGIICRDTSQVGTRIERRQCTTADQRKEMHEDGKAFVERIQTNALIGNTP